MINDLLNKIENMNNLVELHLHLDGALSVDNCRKLAELQNINIPSDDNELLSIISVSKNCHDLNEFLTKFEFPLSLLQTTESIKLSIKNLQEELIKQGLIYAEIRFSPQLHTKKGLTQEEVVQAAIEGLNLSKLKCNLILCCMRGKNNNKENIDTIKLASKYINRGVCAVDLAGAEGLYSTSEYENLFKLANELNVPFTIHAGEADGANSVYDAIRFGAKRIGHGVRSSEDSKVLDLIKEKEVTLEICPTSNICTSVYEKISDMPIKMFLDNHIKITINTDDPIICNTNLKEELKKIAVVFNLNYDNIINFQLNAVNASFASKKLKEELIDLLKN